MKAVVKTKEDVGLEVLDRPRPRIKPNEVLLKVTGCGICGSDLGLYDWTAKGRTRGDKTIKVPVIIGHEPAGIVEEVGANVTQNIKVGDKVAADSWGGCGECYFCRMGKFNLCLNAGNIGSLSDGAMAEYVALPPFNLYKVREGIPMEEAPIAQPLGVAIRALEVANLKPGDDIVVLGPGPIGIMLAMMARACGAAGIWITGLGADKQRLEFARKQGFEAINVEDQPVVDIVRKATGGLGVDNVFDVTETGGGPEKVKLLKRGGQLVITASTTGPLTFDGSELRRIREPKILFNWARNPSSFYRAINLMAAGRINVKPLITYMPLEDADKGFQLLKNRQAMKIILVP